MGGEAGRVRHRRDAVRGRQQALQRIPEPKPPLRPMDRDAGDRAEQPAQVKWRASRRASEIVQREALAVAPGQELARDPDPLHRSRKPAGATARRGPTAGPDGTANRGLEKAERELLDLDRKRAGIRGSTGGQPVEQVASPVERTRGRRETDPGLRPSPLIRAYQFGRHPSRHPKSGAGVATRKRMAHSVGLVWMSERHGPGVHKDVVARDATDVRPSAHDYHLVRVIPLLPGKWAHVMGADPVDDLDGRAPEEHRDTRSHDQRRLAIRPGASTRRKGSKNPEAPPPLEHNIAAMRTAALPVTPRGLPQASSRPERVAAIDLLRGTVIVLMVLDHVRWFLSSARFDPTDPAQTTVALFFTRWVTHFCAPVFMLLAGVGAYLSLDRGRNRAGLSRFLLTRGLWLVLLELTIARLGWTFNLDYRYASALVLWALGWSMVALAVIVRLPTAVAAAVSTIMIVGHNLVDGVKPESWGASSWLWTVLHVPGVIEGFGARFEVLYPLIPWIGVMAAGFLVGPVFAAPPTRRDRVLLTAGVGLTAAFVALRLVNAYGDPTPWTSQTTPVRTALSFLATTKYPPSLAFLLMTLGPVLAAVPLVARWSGAVAEVVRTLGRVPLFFWLLHVPLIHAIAVLLSVIRYRIVIPWLVENPPAEPPAGYGYGLVVVYGATLGVVALLFPACRWFAELKRRRRDRWLSYL